MTLRELSIYYKLHERLERNREMLSSLSAAAGPGAQVITGMPHAPGVSDKVGDSGICKIGSITSNRGVTRKRKSWRSTSAPSRMTRPA